MSINFFVPLAKTVDDNQLFLSLGDNKSMTSQQHAFVLIDDASLSSGRTFFVFWRDSFSSSDYWPEKVSSIYLG